MDAHQVFQQLNNLRGRDQNLFERVIAELMAIIPNFEYNIFTMYFVNNISETWISNPEILLERYHIWVQEWELYMVQIESAPSSILESVPSAILE